MKSINLVWLSKTDLANMNAGEGSSNVVEIKTYDRGRKPYVSGQAMRHAIKAAMARENYDTFKCVAEAPCGDIKTCWSCDLFGYLNPKEDEGSDRRWSPLKVSPALGQITDEIVTDMLLRFAQDPKNNAIAYIQLMANVYKAGICLDYHSLGRKEKIVLKDKKVTTKEIEELYSEDERKKRAKALIEAIANLADTAKQARNMTSLSPDILIISVQEIYNHRLQKAIEVTDDGTLNIGTLKAVIKDLKTINCQITTGFTPGIIKNDEEFLEALKELNLEPLTPREAINRVLEGI